MNKDISKEGDISKVSRRGKFHTDKLPEKEIRHHCISVRLNEEELILLDRKRGQYKKGEWLRKCTGAGVSLKRRESALYVFNSER
ncbi:hypothetical protein QNH14_01430 [Apirhabdus apintestini]|nr:hypothetical protein QNH14_01430 [Enterobacteriaceae bacterium CA-0114]